MRIDLPDEKDLNVILQIRNYQLFVKMFFNQENVDYALRCIIERNLKGEDKCD